MEIVYSEEDLRRYIQNAVDASPERPILVDRFLEDAIEVDVDCIADGETCVIGSHVKLYHGVTLGARSFEKDDAGHIRKGGKRHPNVEDHVTVYPNSTILGGETVIGARSTIGGNVFLTQSVPPDSLVYYEAKQMKVLPKRDRQPEAAGRF